LLSLTHHTDFAEVIDALEDALRLLEDIREDYLFVGVLERREKR